MAENRTLLVVDDEEVVCQACRRIFSRQGFQVEASTDARQGLCWATEKDYAIILLDIKMPNLDGIQFLEQLRPKKPDVPVLMITGYPSIPNAAAAMRLGACDYVTKPFTLEEITWAVQRVLATRCWPGEEPAAGGEAREAAPSADAVAQTRFWNESWLRLEADGSASVGAVLPGLRGAAPTGIRLPRIGEVVYQGLPLAGVTVPDKPMLIVPSPVSGVVLAINESLPKQLDWLSSDPCGDGCIACISSTRHEEIGNCKPRRIVLVNSDPSSAEGQTQKLAALGCQVERAGDREALVALLKGTDAQPVLLDAASLGDAGPELAGLVNEQAPSARIVVVGSPGISQETSFRQHKIFYYAVEPFGDNEIADILAGLFQSHETQPPKTERHKEPSEPISGVSITNRNGHKVQLLAGPGLLWRDEGLGCLIGQKLLARMFPLVITPGESYLTPANILKTAAVCDRLMVLLAKDSGLLPGSLVRDTKPDFGVDPKEPANKVTMMAVQPDLFGGFACLDARTIGALADHIVWDMASY
jgi:DNA-binding response OmpR family regulator/glycine cleavage system H lipoate-binding protein